MNSIQKRFILFLFGCISVRSIFVIISKNYQNYLPLMGKLAFIPAIGFLYIYFNNLRTTGNGAFGEKIWWTHLRPIHGLLYGVFGLLAINSNCYSWVVLLIDVIIGLISFLVYHYNEGNFSKLC
jgi:hypothetical protein